MKFSRLCYFILIGVLTAGSAIAAQSSGDDVIQSDEPLRLEATIRGNKEQPSVLSIVPWQLPKHRTIEGALIWQPAGTKPVPIERTSFLRRLALSNTFAKVPPAEQ